MLQLVVGGAHTLDLVPLQWSLVNLIRSKRREYESESKNENRAKDLRTLDLLSSSVAE